MYDTMVKVEIWQGMDKKESKRIKLEWKLQIGFDAIFLPVSMFEWLPYRSLCHMRPIRSVQGSGWYLYDCSASHVSLYHATLRFGCSMQPSVQRLRSCFRLRLCSCPATRSMCMCR